jgi:hypothetical protein
MAFYVYSNILQKLQISFVLEMTRSLKQSENLMFMWFSYNKNQTVCAATSSRYFRSLYDTLKTLVRHYLYMVEQEK